MTNVSFAFPEHPRALAFRNEPSGDLWTGRASTMPALAEQIGPCVYFFRTEEDRIKIGFTTNLARRRRRLGLPWASLLAVERGSYDDEQALHRRFRTHLVAGREWYYPAAEIVEYIDDARVRLGVPRLDPDQW